MSFYYPLFENCVPLVYQFGIDQNQRWVAGKIPGIEDINIQVILLFTRYVLGILFCQILLEDLVELCHSPSAFYLPVQNMKTLQAR